MEGPPLVGWWVGVWVAAALPTLHKHIYRTNTRVGLEMECLGLWGSLNPKTPKVLVWGKDFAILRCRKLWTALSFWPHIYTTNTYHEPQAQGWEMAGWSSRGGAPFGGV